jgi:hypothetical protein
VLLALPAGALAAGGPSASTGTAREASGTTAVLTGTVNPNGQATTYAFQYGTTTQYAQETGVQSAGSGSTPVAVAATVTGLQPGTTYHFRLLAANASGSAAGSDLTFKTAGLAPPPAPAPHATTGPATSVEAHEAALNGTVDTAGSTVRYYFQIGTRLPYVLQTLPRTAPASKAPVQVQAPVLGLASGQTYHYRLVVVSENGETAAGSDLTFATPAGRRASPRALEVSASPRVQRRLPAVVTVSGRLVLPAGVSAARACRGGFVDITFRVRTIAIQMLRAGLHSNCSFRLPVRFSVRRRLLGGHVQVHVLFPGNGFLRRLEGPVRTVQIG